MFKPLLLLVFLAPAINAQPVETQFACKTEESAKKIGASFVVGLEEGDQVADSLVMTGACRYFGQKIYAYVVHRGPTFGTEFKVTVVGLSSRIGQNPEMWAVMPTDQLRDDGTI